MLLIEMQDHVIVHLPQCTALCADYAASAYAFLSSTVDCAAMIRAAKGNRVEPAQAALVPKRARPRCRGAKLCYDGRD